MIAEFLPIMAGLAVATTAFATGLWVLLSVYWFKTQTGSARIALLWTAFCLLGSLGIRIYTAVIDYETEFHALDWVRLFFNFAIIGLGLYLGRWTKDGPRHD